MDFLVWLESTAIADAIRTSRWMYAALETGHYLGLAMLVGGITVIDLRMLGVAKSLPVRAVLGLLPWVWAGLIINAATGSLIFIYGATNFGTSGAFLLKMTFIVLAGLNALLFQVLSTRSGKDWVAANQVPIPAKAVATASFVLWLCVVTTGRWMAYV